MTLTPTIPVEIAQGLVAGLPSEFDPSVTVYRGIPFAASTGGENRFRPPQPPLPWSGVRLADKNGSPCPQIPFGPMVLSKDQDEDCLNLNVWTPGGRDLPVYVWIYGGRFIAGSGSQLPYDGTGLAKEGVVVVTINYRVGILGFLAHPELDAESYSGGSGNWGIHDQIQALKWVQQNIHAFGGDPAKVTIGGQSAGAASCGLLVMSPLAKGLFRAAIPQSGMRIPNDPLLSGLAPAYRSRGKALSQGEQTLKEKGLASITEARSASLDLLLEGNNKNDDVWGNPPFYRPCIDGHLFPGTYEECWTKGIQNDVAVMTGHNADEGGTYADPDFDEDDFRSCARQKYGALGDRFIELYPIQNGSALETWNEAARDNSRVTTALWAELYGKHAKSPVYGYIYTHAPPAKAGGPDAPPPSAGQKAKQSNDDATIRPQLRIYEKAVPRSQYTYSKLGTGARFGAFHGAEIPYTFNNLYAQPDYAWRPIDYEVAKSMSGYWLNFVKTGDPNGEGLPPFPTSTLQGIMQLGAECTEIPLAPTPERAAFWKEHLAAQPAW